MGAPKKWIDSVGGWKAYGGEVYNRVSAERARWVQDLVGRRLRDTKFRVDVLVEADDIEELSERLRRRGADEEKTAAVMQRMRMFESPYEGLSFGGLVGEDKGVKEREVDPMEEGEVGPPESGYVVSMSGRKGLRRLHYIGLCHRLLGIDYLRWEALGEAEPGEEQYDACCKQCWPKGRGSEEETEAEEESDSEE